MYIIPPLPGEGDLERQSRKPADAPRLAAQGWLFLVENRRWDSDDREAVARATGLYALAPTVWMHETDAWFKAFASAYSQLKCLSAALQESAGISKKAITAPRSEPMLKAASPIHDVNEVGVRWLTPEERDELRRSGREKLAIARAYFKLNPL